MSDFQQNYHLLENHVFKILSEKQWWTVNAWLFNSLFLWAKCALETVGGVLPCTVWCWPRRPSADCVVKKSFLSEQVLGEEGSEANTCLRSSFPGRRVSGKRRSCQAFWQLVALSWESRSGSHRVWDGRLDELRPGEWRHSAPEVTAGTSSRMPHPKWLCSPLEVLA